MSADADRERLEKEIQHLRLAVQELSMLNEITTAISSTMALDKILDLIIQKSLKHLNVEQGAIMLLDEQAADKPFQTMVRGGATVSRTLPYRLDNQLMGWMLKNRQPLLINDFQADTRFLKKGEELFKIRSLLCVPLKSKGRMTGIICLFNSKSDAGFSESNQRLLAIVATQSAQVIENARLLEEEQALMKVQEELRLAYDIQMNLLPEKNPEIEGYDLAGRSIPAKEVGGDYYDLIPGEGGQLAFCLGDISGKGLPAALLMASLQATIRGQTILKAAPGACLAHANTLMIQNTSPEKFASLFYGQLDTASHRLIYANAGHNYPLLFSGKKSCRRLESDAIVLGCLEDFDYPEGEVTLAPGDLLLVYSDGITEAFNEKEEEFGEGNLCRVILAHRDLAAADLVDTVINEVQQYAAGLPQHDDITLVIIRRLK